MMIKKPPREKGSGQWRSEGSSFYSSIGLDILLVKLSMILFLQPK
jgi:hypothetical protein